MAAGQQVAQMALGEVPVVGGVLSSIAGTVAGDPKKNQEREAAIQQLAQSGNIAQLEEWATGQPVNGDSSRADEPEASRLAASQALQSLGYSVPAQFNGQTINGSNLNASQLAELSAMGGSPTASGGSSSSGSPLSTIAGLGTTALGVAAANTEANQAQHETNLANQNTEQQYNATAGLRAQGINQMQNAVSQQPDLSAMFAAPSNPFSRSAPVSGTPLPAVTSNATGAASTNPVGVNTAASNPATAGQPLPAVKS